MQPRSARGLRAIGLIGQLFELVERYGLQLEDDSTCHDERHPDLPIGLVDDNAGFSRIDLVRGPVLAKFHHYVLLLILQNASRHEFYCVDPLGLQIPAFQ